MSFLIQRNIFEIFIHRINAEETRFRSSPLYYFKCYITFVSDDVIEPGNVIVTMRCERDFPLLSTETCVPRFSRVPRDTNGSPLFDRLESHQFPCLHEFSIILFIFPSTSPNGFNSYPALDEAKRFMVDRQHTAIYRNPLNYLYDPLQHFATHSATVNTNIICYASLGNARCSRFPDIFLQFKYFKIS